MNIYLINKHGRIWGHISVGCHDETRYPCSLQLHLESVQLIHTVFVKLAIRERSIALVGANRCSETLKHRSGWGDGPTVRTDRAHPA